MSTLDFVMLSANIYVAAFFVAIDKPAVLAGSALVYIGGVIYKMWAREP